MSDAPVADEAADERERLKIRLAGLEADIAYFEARLEILGEPKTTNQRAQFRVYRLLGKSLGKLTEKVKRSMEEA